PPNSRPTAMSGGFFVRRTLQHKQQPARSITISRRPWQRQRAHGRLIAHCIPPGAGDNPSMDAA
ncbi:hypothetical protein, partial [Falsiroseomonas sp.]|uniref:hypothetical protein n=1 Tax=Falsiroseomonas sp. TaxID=2870721 RepID=UPI003F6EE50C